MSLPHFKNFDNSVYDFNPIYKSLFFAEIINNDLTGVKLTDDEKEKLTNNIVGVSDDIINWTAMLVAFTSVMQKSKDVLVTTRDTLKKFAPTCQVGDSEIYFYIMGWHFLVLH